MAGSIISAGTNAWAAWRSLPHPERVRISGWAVWIATATLVFVRPLTALLSLARENELHSHIPLIPLVTAYLLFIQRGTLPAPGRSSILGTLAMSSVAIAAGSWGIASPELSATDRIAVMTFAYAALVAGGGFLFLGAKWMSAAAFPIALLIFIVPLPDAAVEWLERASVQASADVAAWMFRATGTPLLREGTIFALPTIVVEVARECSGIRSSWVLFITSLVASHMFLKSPWRRLVLVAFVMPLGIVRNGFRILTIGLLCVHVGPHMIDSFIHHRGGPIFFVLSLGPLFLLLTWLRRRDRVA
ncbi:MAG: exosortase/archaeosortase family protein [Vicinamibacterales bacterium]